MSAVLPLDIIITILGAESNKVISIYNKVQHDMKVSLSKSLVTSNITENNSKRLKNDNNHNNSVLGNKSRVNYLIKQLNDPVVVKQIYSKSSWLKYFIDINSEQKVIDVILAEVIKYFDLLERIYKKKKYIHKLKLNNLLENFENCIDGDGIKFNSQKYKSYLDNLSHYYGFNIPIFIKLVILLYSCNYFQSGEQFHKLIHNILESIITYSKSSDDYNNSDSSNNSNNHMIKQEVLQSYPYYASKYKFIPIFNIYMGMGYTFVIGWDCIINRMIGFMENGSSYVDVIMNSRFAMRYFALDSRSRKIIPKVKLQKVEDYLALLGYDCIETVGDYCNQLNIAGK